MIRFISFIELIAIFNDFRTNKPGINYDLC